MSNKKDILHQREGRLKKGNDEFADWNDAKNHIRDRFL